jgi:hypothetical protein
MAQFRVLAAETAVSLERDFLGGTRDASAGVSGIEMANDPVQLVRRC